MPEPRFGGMLGDPDTRDVDQKAYCVHFNKHPFHTFNDKYQKLKTERFAQEFEQLSIDMMTHFHEKMQPPEEFRRKMEWCRRLKTSIQKHNAKWLFDVVPTGSSVNGLATADSDLDVAIHIPHAMGVLSSYSQNQDAEKRKIELEILQIVRRILQNDKEICDEIEGDIQLVMAQIQILKIVTTEGIECDVSVVLLPFLSSLHNSFLIRHFVHIDSRFAPLCAIVKEWAASTKVKNPKDGGFNSYALVLLVIHFLQSGTNPPILPHLQQVYKGENFVALDEHNFPKRLDFGAPLPWPLPEITRNSQSVAVLFFEFVHYYLSFDFARHFISMRNARIMSRKETAESRVRNEENKCVYIEDPFDAHNPGRTVRGDGFLNIRCVLSDTLNLFIPTHDDNPGDFKFPTLDDIINMMSTKEPEHQEDEEEEENVENEEEEVE